MALIKCKNCGKNISDTSSTCIHCGEPIEKQKKISWFKKHKSISILLLVLVIVLGVFLVYEVIRYKDSGLIVINGNSMSPILKDGEKKFYNKTDKIERFDIIVFVDENNNTLVKRVYGLPEETISFSDEVIFIGSKRIVEDKYANGSMVGHNSVTLKSDEYYVLGDNRDVSRDSRSFGPVKKSNIKGKLYGGNDKKIEIIEEISKKVRIDYEVKNKNLLDEVYHYEIYTPFDEVVVTDRKDIVDKVDYIKVIIDFKDIKNVRVGENVLYDLSLIAYDKENNVVNNIYIVSPNASSTVNVSVKLTEK